MTSKKAFENCKKRWDEIPPPSAKYILQTICDRGWGFLNEMAVEIDLFARNSFSHMDYLIDEQKYGVHLFSLEEEREWSKEDLDTNNSTIWVYFTALHIEWILTIFPLLKKEKEVG